MTCCYINLAEAKWHIAWPSVPICYASSGSQVLYLICSSLCWKMSHNVVEVWHFIFFICLITLRGFIIYLSSVLTQLLYVSYNCFSYYILISVFWVAWDKARLNVVFLLLCFRRFLIKEYSDFRCRQCVRHARILNWLNVRQ